MKRNIVIIGGGPAGMAAAIAAKENGVDGVLIIERGERLGGILPQCIHNGFGLHHFEEELTGPEYALRFIKQVNALGIEVLTDTMVLDMTPERTLTVISPKHGTMEIDAKAVVLAMGCRERTRGALLIPGTRPAGIFTAGAAQRLVNIEGYLPGRKAVILGSGDIGLIMARRLTLEGAEVKLICEIMPYSSGLTRNIVQCVEDFDIPLKFNHTITRIHGTQRVEGVTAAQVDEHRQPIPDTEFFVECDTILLSVGLIPENELSKSAGVILDNSTGGPIVDEHMRTLREGVFACGNAVHVHDLVDFVTEEAFRAGAGAARYVKGEPYGGERAVVRAGNRVRYAVPQFICGSGEHILYFRPTDVYRKANIVVYADAERVYSKRAQIVTPGEMQRVTVNLKHAPSQITVAVELPEQDFD
ncbi:MAG: NAD(P)/FAD-dependent oxidoreductase [Oscillospiraceae bacterium]|nr:NAD(P)/FAD-dependent oxidoreductase [Oscillospiraceae bacterium]